MKRDTDSTATIEAPPAELLTIADLCAILQVGERTVYRLVDRREMPRPIKLGGANRWSKTAIDAWIKGGCKPLPTK